MERNLIAWTLPNWITIMLMAAMGYLLVALLSQFVLNGFEATPQTVSNGTY